MIKNVEFKSLNIKEKSITETIFLLFIFKYTLWFYF